MTRFSKILLAALLVCAAMPAMKAAGGFDQLPAPDRTAMPVYPADLAAKHIEGIVVLRVSIDGSGNVTGVQAVKSTDSRFEQSAIDCVSKKWHFKPAMKAGEGVPCTVTIPIRFSR